MSTSNNLEKEFKYYVDNKSKLVGQYKNKFLVIRNETVQNSFDNIDQALSWASEKFGLGTFIVQHCTEGDEGHVQTFHSRVVFA